MWSFRNIAYYNVVARKLFFGSKIFVIVQNWYYVLIARDILRKYNPKNDTIKYESIEQ